MLVVGSYNSLQLSVTNHLNRGKDIILFRDTPNKKHKNTIEEF